MKSDDNKVTRFSQNQKDLRGVLISLIKLYYSNDYSKPEKEWAWKDINRNLNEFIIGVYGSDCECIYDKNRRRFKVSHFTPSSDISIEKKSKSYKYNISVKQIRLVASMMNRLTETIKSDSLYHLELVGVADDLKTKLTAANLENDTKRNLVDENSSQELSSLHQNIMKEGIVLMNRTIKKTIPKDYDHKHEEGVLYNAEVSHLRKYRVHPFTEFGNFLLSSKNEDAIKRISPYASPNVKTIQRLSRYILIYYHLAFGGFDRIKICKYNQCQKLFFEQRKRNHEFCSDLCRAYDDRAQYPLEKRKCKDRQNAWARNKQLKYTIQKHDCLICESPAMKTSSCLKLNEKNKDQN